MEGPADWIVDPDGKVRGGITPPRFTQPLPLPSEANLSQETPDDDPSIVPAYMLRRIEAMRRYPLEDDRPGKDPHSVTRQAFIDGAEWEAERNAGDA